MGIKEWNKNKSQSFTFGSNLLSSKREKQRECIRLGKKYDHDFDHDQDQDQDQGSRWKVLWRKIKREKQRIFMRSNTFNNGSCSSAIVVAYDPEAYSRNFDDGSGCREPEYLTRSFSARFADPSRIVHHNRFLKS